MSTRPRRSRSLADFRDSEKQEPNTTEAAIRKTIRSIPAGKVATYGQVAEAAGYPLHHRQVARVLRKFGDALPWHRVIGAGGQIKTLLDSALEQRLRLEMEGVRFRGSRVDMAASSHTWNSPGLK